MSPTNTGTGSRTWREQRWLIDGAIATQGIEFDQNRLRYSLGPAGSGKVG